MNYKSTRSDNISVSASEAIVKGLAADGGLFVPCEFPAVSADEIQAMAGADYKARAKLILKKFLTDFTEAEVDDCVEKAYTAEKFGSDDSAPLYKLSDNDFVLELWHGPTCAFKDMALQILPHLLTKSMKKTGVSSEVVILVATSGDTGKAALEGFKDVEGTRIIVFYPVDGVSNIQKLQMVTQAGENVAVAAVEGNFDDAQSGVKSIFTDKAYGEMLLENNMVFSSANSINWGRLVPQIVYYFSAYADLLAKGEIKNGEEINIVVPTGNFGNILAAYYARKMGLPVHKLICASNSNNVLTDFINTGKYDRNRKFYTTISPSMDILISSNLERFLYDLTGNDDKTVAKWMSALSENGEYTVDDKTLALMKEIMCAGCCNDKETLTSIADTKKKYDYVTDTHTAVAVKVCEEYRQQSGDTRKTVIASTASPYKFGDSVLSALGVTVEGDEFEVISVLNRESQLPVPESLASLKSREVRFDEVCAPAKMRDMVKKLLGITE
ncbi:MAG: threonine synthase [Clostridia bacterium]|nr:threonine synthase [Clostridia bacterium]